MRHRRLRAGAAGSLLSISGGTAFPLAANLCFKILFWLAVALSITLILVGGHYLNLELRALPLGGFVGTLPGLMGSALFVGIWLAYGFCTGQMVVLLCA